MSFILSIFDLGALKVSRSQIKIISPFQDKNLKIKINLVFSAKYHDFDLILKIK